MTRITPAQLAEAARAAVVTAVEERTVALTEAEARTTSGGASEPFILPTLSGAIMQPTFPTGGLAL